ncbi:MAG: ROK family protein [Alphaproteobacteria bacterium]
MRIDPGLRIGVDLGGTKIEAIAIGPDGAQLFRRRRPTPRGAYAPILEAISGLVREAEAALGAHASVGVGIPGTISPATGLVKNANSTELIGHPLHRDLGALLDREVRVANDADCFALSEAVDGAGRGARSVFAVILGTGVGGGLVHAGIPVTGPNSIAGEWGHNPLPWPRDDERPGPRCYCGLDGCIETFLCGPAFARDHAARAGGGRTRRGRRRVPPPPAPPACPRCRTAPDGPAPGG